MRRFPAPWKIEPLDSGSFKVTDASGQSLAYVYGHADARVASARPKRADKISDIVPMTIAGSATSGDLKHVG